MTDKDMSVRLALNGIPHAVDLPEKLVAYLQILREWNARMDLTGDAEDEEWADRHLMDSLTVLKTDLLPAGARLIDVGTGAGFPGLVLALARPDLSVTLLDAQQKRLRFIEVMAETMGRKDIRLLHARAEDAARLPECREVFDIAVARAVAPLNVLCEYLLPFVRVGGEALCWKGPGIQREWEAGKRAAFLLGGRLEDPIACPIAGRDWEHMIQPISKTRPAPKEYPRKPGMPQSHPIAAFSGKSP